MLGSIISFLTVMFIWFLIGLVSNAISRANWVEREFPGLADKLSKELNLEISNTEALSGITIGPEKKNHILLGKSGKKLSVKYFYNYKRFLNDITQWKYDKEQPIDDIIISIKMNIEKTESLPIKM